ncbi:hypothetical protein ANN_13968 [Periplaneta americana]|uniref:Fibronectin type-III domain-containing protein n=1 Tax=Periplaneta americana TaxID=6978 RepID=A0ABQ8SV07_PERAM|nr:hypothetical protein ANN_13968 [Periplaneta americana]
MDDPKKRKGLPPIPGNVTVAERRRGRTVIVEWAAPHQASPVLYLMEERHHVGRHFTAARLGNWVPRHRSSRTNVTLKNALRPGHWYQFRVAAINGNGTRGFSDPSEPFTLSVEKSFSELIRTKLADALRKLKYTVYEEVHGTADNGSNRRIDIIAISESLSQGMIIDPIRFETYKGQPEDVHEEKRAIYVPTILYYKDKYQLHDISVTGLMFGARGTIPNFSSQFSPKAPGPPLKLSVGSLVRVNGSLWGELSWEPPDSDLPIQRYKVFWSRRLQGAASSLISVLVNHQTVPRTPEPLRLIRLLAHGRDLDLSGTEAGWPTVQLRQIRKGLGLRVPGAHQAGRPRSEIWLYQGLSRMAYLSASDSQMPPRPPVGRGQSSRIRAHNGINLT